MTFSSRCMTSEDWNALKHFRAIEFHDPDKMGFEFIQWLDQLREVANVPMVITSSYRNPIHNRAVGGAVDSAHTDVPCSAVDIGERPRPDDPNWNRTRWAIITAAIKLGCRRIGSYGDGSLHLDRTEDKRPADRMWRVVGSVAT